MKKIACLVACLFVGSANATFINFGPASASGSGPVINFNNLATPTTIIGDAVFTLNVNGDFNTNIEYADLMLDGFNLGRILDNNPANDLFNFTNDVGNQSVSTITGIAVIAEIDFASLITDGFLNFSFDTSSSVDCCGTVNHVSGSFSFDSVESIPISSSLALLGIGLLAIGFSRNESRRGFK